MKNRPWLSEENSPSSSTLQSNLIQVREEVDSVTNITWNVRSKDLSKIVEDDAGKYFGWRSSLKIALCLFLICSKINNLTSSTCSLLRRLSNSVNIDRIRFFFDLPIIWCLTVQTNTIACLTLHTTVFTAIMINHINQIGFSFDLTALVSNG